MQIIEFVITGNQENPKGNPIPYTRVTQGTKWTDKALRYGAWKDHVVQQFERAAKASGFPLDLDDQQAVREMIRTGRPTKPIRLEKSTARMDIRIEWANEAHADADNIFKGILDALFVNDKNVTAGSFESKKSADGVGKVFIKITKEN